LRAVGVLFDLRFDRHVRCRPMMLRPVEFDAARAPRSCEPDERRLDHVLAIEKIVVVCFVEPDVDAAADFRKHHHADEFIFDVQSLPGVRDRLGRDSIVKRQRIDGAAAALIDALFEEHRIFVGRHRQIRGNRDGLGRQARSANRIGS
jgi:hypothetical protein